MSDKQIKTTDRTGEFYAGEEDGLFYVFHTETGKAYASYSSFVEAEADAATRNKETRHPPKETQP